MITKLNINLKKAIVFSLIFNSALVFSGFYARTYDSYGHMFFADHYRRTWFNTWEPKWYAGFSITTYPPLAHQSLALISLVTGLELAYEIITLLLLVLLPLGIFKFSQVFVSEDSAGYASLIGVFLPGVFSSIYLWGQFTTLFSLILALFSVASMNKFLNKGSLLYFIESIFLFEATLAAHHFSGIIFTPSILLITFLITIFKKGVNFKTILKRFLLFLSFSLIFSILVIYPVFFGASPQNVNIPHPSTSNYFINAELFWLFFISMYGFILLLIPLTMTSIRYHKKLIPLLLLALFFLILGLGGSTPLPQIIFGENWLGLTYERFNLFSILTFTPLFGLVLFQLRKRNKGKILFVALMVSSIFFCSIVGNSSLIREREKEVPIGSIVNFLDTDQHWRWRYLTLGFNSGDFSRISILTNATTLDGWYYRGREIPALANSGIDLLGTAKYQKNGLPVLKSVLENSSQYNLKFIFCNDPFYEPLLNETGFILLKHKYEDVTIWEKTDSPMLEVDEIRDSNHNPSVMEYLWGIIPLTWLIGAFFINLLQISRKYTTKLDDLSATLRSYIWISLVNTHRFLDITIQKSLVIIKQIYNKIEKTINVLHSNSQKTFLAKVHSDLFVILAYFILTLIMFYPFSILNINTQLIGVDGGDTYQGLWNLWWIKQSTLSLQNPYITNYIFYPIGTDLFVHTLSPAAGFFSIPFQLTLGLIFSYNLLIILSFVLSGYGAYRLAYHVTKEKRASFFSGLVFGFSSYHFARAWGHLNLVSIQWIPFFILFVLKMRKESSQKNVYLAVFFLILSTLWADLQYTVFLGLFTIWFLAYEILFERQQIKEFLLRLGIMLVSFFIIILLVLGPLFYGILTGKYAYAWTSPNDFVIYSADLLGFFIPNSLNLFFGNYSQGIISHFSTTGIESVTYIGYTVVALAVIAIAKLWNKAKFWLLSAFVFIIFSLGPILHIFGNSSFTSLNLQVPLPGFLLFSILPIPRVPSRLILMAMLCLAVVTAVTLKHLNNWFTKFKFKKIISLLFISFLSVSFLAEVNMLPFPIVEETSVPSFYGDLAKMDGTFSVLDLPQDYSTNNWANNRYMYYGTVSENPLVGGSISRIDPSNIKFMQVFPVINQIDHVKNGKNSTNWTDILLQDINRTNLNAFFFFDVNYIVLHRDMMESKVFEQMDDYLRGLLGRPVFSDKQIVSFCANSTQLQGNFAFLSKGWWNLEERNGLVTRWMDGNGIVSVVCPSTQYCDVSFIAETEVANKSLKVFLNDKKVGDFKISVGTYSKISLNSLHFKTGLNELVFHSEQSFVPANIFTDSHDTRKLSISFQNISISVK